jgi:hypothetical protein
LGRVAGAGGRAAACARSPHLVLCACVSPDSTLSHGMRAAARAGAGAGRGWAVRSGWELHAAAGGRLAGRPPKSHGEAGARCGHDSGAREEHDRPSHAAPASLAQAGRRSLLWHPPGAWSCSFLCLGAGLRCRRRAPAGRGPPGPVVWAVAGPPALPDPFSWRCGDPLCFSPAMTPAQRVW